MWQGKQLKHVDCIRSMLILSQLDALTRRKSRLSTSEGGLNMI